MKRLTAIAALASATLLGACVPQQPYQPVMGGPVMGGPTRVCDTSIRVINESNYLVHQLYFSHSSLGSWGNDKLGANVLPPGRALNYRLTNPGNYDFRVVWNNGRATEIRQINVCVASQIIVTNRGISAR